MAQHFIPKAILSNFSSSIDTSQGKVFCFHLDNNKSFTHSFFSIRRLFTYGTNYSLTSDITFRELKINGNILEDAFSKWETQFTNLLRSPALQANSRLQQINDTQAIKIIRKFMFINFLRHPSYFEKVLNTHTISLSDYNLSKMAFAEIGINFSNEEDITKYLYSSIINNHHVFKDLLENHICFVFRPKSKNQFLLGDKFILANSIDGHKVSVFIVSPRLCFILSNSPRTYFTLINESDDELVKQVNIDVIFNAQYGIISNSLSPKQWVKQNQRFSYYFDLKNKSWRPL